MRPVKHSVTLRRCNTSISLEPEFWALLKAIAAYQKKPLARLVFDIKRNSGGNLSSTARVYVLNFVKQEIEYGKVLGL